MRKFYLISMRLFALITAVFILHFGTSGQTVQTVTASGTWTVPANVTSIKVEAWGGGGGGGVAFFGSGGGGGGGAYKTLPSIPVTPGQTFSIVIGQGGGSGTDGGQTTFSGNGFSVVAKGGQAGHWDIINIWGNGGAGAEGDRNGGNGGSGDSQGAGGGGGAGNNGHGGNGSNSSAGAGGSGNPNVIPYRGGAGGGSSFLGSGTNGAIPGGGGGGAGFFGSGGSGARGQVVLTYTEGPSVPSISDFSPDIVCATGGQTITISGANFTNPSTVIFPNNISVSATYINSTTLTAVVPNGVVGGQIRVQNHIGTSSPSVKSLVVQNFAPLSVSGAGTYCGSAILSASGGGGGTIYYQGTNATGQSTSQGASVTETTTGTNTFYFREFNSCGWGTAYPITVTINPVPSSFTVDVEPDCRKAKLIPTNLSAYLQTTPNGQDMSRQGVQTVTNEGTFYYRAKSGDCWGEAVPAEVTFKVTAEIIEQPKSASGCVGSTVTFTVDATSTSSVTYQWMRGNEPIPNGGRISGATSNKLTITNIQPTDDAEDIYVLIIDDCNELVSDYVSLRVNIVATAPTTGPTDLTFNPVGITSAVGQFTASSTADYYIVIRSTTPAPIPSPVNGTTYSTEEPGVFVFGANTYIDYIGSENYFVSSNLDPGKQYYYWVYGFNLNPCGTSPLYNHTPATNNITTNTATDCGTINTFYWTGTSSIYPQKSVRCGGIFIPRYCDDFDSDFNNWKNWSTQTNAFRNPLQVVPGPCDNVVIEVNNDVTITMSANRTVNNLTFLLKNTANNNRIARLFTKNRTLMVNGNANIDLTAGRSIVIGEDASGNGKVIFVGNVVLGSTSGRLADISGTTNSSMEFRGSVTFGPSGGMLSPPGKVTFNGLGQDLVINSARPTGFRNIDIVNSAHVTIKGSVPAGNMTGNLSILNKGQLTIPQGQQLNRQTMGGTFTMNSTGSDIARLFVRGTGSTSNGGLPAGSLPQNSNFPGGFSQYNFSGTSNIYYDAGPGAIQEIHSVPTYNNLILRSLSPATVERANTAQITTKGFAQVEARVRWTLGGNVQHGGRFNLLPDGVLMTENHYTTGGVFTMHSDASLGIGSKDGITISGGVGNIRSGGREYSSTGNFIYNGVSNQVTGDGLPTSVKKLTVANTGTDGIVSFSKSNQTYQATDSLILSRGVLSIGQNTLVVNGFARSAGLFGGSHVSSLSVNTVNLPLYFEQTNGLNYLKELKLESSKTGYIRTTSNDTLNITGGYDAHGQAGHLKLNTGSQLTTTGGNLTLKSNKFGTASLAEIPVNGAGNALASIVGPVIVERHINSGTAAGEHGKAWLFLATPTKGQTIRQSWMENKSSSTAYGIQLTGPQHGGDWDKVSPAPAIKRYNEATNMWVGASSSGDQLYNKAGWMVFVRGDRTVKEVDEDATPANLRSKGTVITGDQSYPIGAAPSGSNGNWFSSIGNPFPSAIDMRTVFDQSTGGEEYFTIWNPSIVEETDGSQYGLGAYQTFFKDPDTGEFMNVPFYVTNNYVESGQAFFVQKNAAPWTLKIPESAKAEVSGGFSPFRTMSGSTTRPSMLRSNILSGSLLVDGTLHMFSSDYSNAVNEGDARKMFNTGLNLAIKAEGKSLIIERREPITVKDTIFYSMTGATNGSYRFMFNARDLSAPGLEAWLEDAFTKQHSPVSLEGVTEIPFEVSSAAASKAADRFRLVFKRAGALPVTFVKLNAVKDGRNVDVQWTVAREQNVKEYVVMSSADGNNFTDIATVTARGLSDYHVTDSKPVEGYNYYRVRSIDLDGETSYSEIARVYMGDAQPNLKVFPNPITDGNVYLRLENYPAGKYQVRLLNPGGQVMLTRSFEHAGGNYTERIPWDYKMAHGNYYLEVKHPDGSVKVIVVMY